MDGPTRFLRQKRLLELSDESSLGEETRESAKKAAQNMSKLSQRGT